MARRGGPTWASAPTEVCCGRYRPAKMLHRGGACPRPRAAIKAALTSGVPSPAGCLAALEACRGGCPHPPGADRWPGRCGPTWASAPTEVCCGRHRPAKMLRRGGACPRPRAATRAAPTSGVLSPAGCLAALEACRGGCPHPPGTGRWSRGAGRCGHRPLQRSAAAGTARPKCSVGAGLVPARGRPQGPPLHFRGSVSGGLSCGAWT